MSAESSIAMAARTHFGLIPTSVVQLDRGYYARVYLVRFPDHRAPVVAKRFNSAGRAEAEAAQLQLLRKHGTIRTPEVYAVDEDQTLFLEYIIGVNAGRQRDLTPVSKARIRETVVENLIAYHSTEHPHGFGGISESTFESTWPARYRQFVLCTLTKARSLRDAGALAPATHDVVEQAWVRFDQVFQKDDSVPRLIHGDYNMWNVMLNQESTDAIAVLDPFDVSWADSELDLFQLERANGTDLGLLDRYVVLRGVSDHFETKKLYYRLFSDLGHFFDTEQDLGKSDVAETASRLRTLLQ